MKHKLDLNILSKDFPQRPLIRNGIIITSGSGVPLEWSSEEGKLQRKTLFLREIRRLELIIENIDKE